LIDWLYFIGVCITVAFGLALWFLLDGVIAMLIRKSLERQKALLKAPIKLLVKNRIDHADDLFSVELATTGFRRLPKFMAGQYLTVRVPILNNHGMAQIDTRRYSLARWHKNPKTYTLGIRAVDGGKVSNALRHSLKVGSSVIEVLPPSGHFVCHAQKKQVVFIGAGIGITPMAAMLDQIIALPFPPQVHLLHSARYEHELLYQDRFLVLEKKHSWFKYSPFLTQPKGGWLHKTGRIQSQDVLSNIQDITECEVYMCAKLEMMQEMERVLIDSGVPATQIYWESFGGIAANGDQQAYQVKIAGADTHVFSGEVSLLNAMESWQVAIDADCRAGDCGACKVKLLSGICKHQMPALYPLGENEVLSCCVTPSSDIEIKLIQQN
jgi:hypothetical protein